MSAGHLLPSCSDDFGVCVLDVTTKESNHNGGQEGAVNSLMSVLAGSQSGAKAVKEFFNRRPQYLEKALGHLPAGSEVAVVTLQGSFCPVSALPCLPLGLSTLAQSGPYVSLDCESLM